MPALAAQTSVHDLRSEKSMTLDQVMDHRLALAAKYLKWEQARIKGFRAGFKAGREDKVDWPRKHAQDGREPDGTNSPPSTLWLDSVGYCAGLAAAEALAQMPVDYTREPERMKEFVAGWSANSNGDFDIDDATWTADVATDISAFIDVHGTEGWISWFVAEHEASIEDGRAGYADLLLQDTFEAVVFVAYPDGRIDIWDGFHRIAAAVLKGAGVIPAIKGVPAYIPELKSATM